MEMQLFGLLRRSFEPGRVVAHVTDALDVVRELLGILNAWAGMPLRLK